MKYLLISLLVGIFSHSSVLAKNFATQMMESTFKLYHKNSTGTCFLVRGDTESDKDSLYLVTAAHVLERMKGDTAIIVLRKKNEDGGYERHDHTINIRSEETPLWLKHKTKDLAVLKLNKSLPVPTNALPYSAIAAEKSIVTAKLELGSGIFVLAYPERFEANKAGFPIARQSIISSYPILPIKKYATYLADYPTFSGDSGGPVFIADKSGNLLLVGIVLAKNHNDERIKTQFEERVVKHSLNLGVVLHAQFIRDVITKSLVKKK